MTKPRGEVLRTSGIFHIIPGVRSTVTRHTLLPLIPTLGFAAGAGRRAATISHLQFLDPFPGDFCRFLAADLDARWGFEYPFAIDRIQDDVDILTMVFLAHIMAATINRHLAFAVHTDRKSVV